MAKQASNDQRSAKGSWHTVQKLFVDYAGRSTIHGVSYIAEKGRSWFEKVWWIAVFCISMLCCGKLIWDAWNINPIIITFTKKPTPIWQTTFPTITICSYTFAEIDPINLTKIIEYQKRGENLFQNLTEKEKMQTIAKNVLCQTDTSRPVADLKYWIKDVAEYENCNGCLDAIREIKMPLHEMLIECKFRNSVINCSEYFKETIVNHRLCYTFNEFGFYRQHSVNHKSEEAPNEDWTIDGGYKPTASVNAFPYRALGAGPEFGLSVLLRVQLNRSDQVCVSEEGFFFEFRTPYELPRFATNFFEITMQELVNFILTPQMIVTADELRNYPAPKRNCYYSNERRLKYFKEYKQSNCEIECQVDFIRQNCSCVPMFIENLRGVDFCGPVSFGCMLEAEHLLLRNNFEDCGCLPACTSISFDTEVSRTNLNDSLLTKSSASFRNGYKYSRVNFYFKRNELLAQQRAELYGNIDFLANCGGLLGLFLGLSVISCLEVVYFCTIRLWYDCRRNERTDCGESTSVEEIPVTRANRYLLTIKELTIDYFNKTTVQGISSVANSSLTMIERIWWAIVVAASVICCGSLIADNFARYDQSPVTISYANEETLISNIPFPAITICPQFINRNIVNIIKYFKVNNGSLYNLNLRSLNITTAIAQVCSSGILDDIDPKNQTDCDHCAEFLKLMMGEVGTVFLRCFYLTSRNRCPELLKAVTREEGACFVYNSLEVFRNTREIDADIIEEWTLEGGYTNSTDRLNSYPQVAAMNNFGVYSKYHAGLIDSHCKSAIQGFKVYLHLPNETPQMSKHFYFMPFDQYTSILIKPRVTVTKPELRDYSVEKRQCYFGDERNLRFFRHYTQNNCEIECEVNQTLTRCGCLMFYMPKILGVRMCGVNDKKCSQIAVVESANESNACNCLQTCTSISYDAEVNHVRFDPNSPYRIAAIVMSFQKGQYIALERSQLFGKTEFLANCGGLLGLFLGFSIISILELIYFFTIRLVCNFKVQFFTRK